MLQISQSVLIVVDVQGKLAGLMPGNDQLFHAISALIRAAQILNIPIIVTEQLPDKIGPTIDEIRNLFPDFKTIIKSSFGCFGSPEFKKKVEALKRRQIILCGIETHVCLYQTASAMLTTGYEVHVVADAVASRSEENKTIAIERLRKEGAIINSTEMVATELIGGADHPKFKEILKLIR